MASGDVVNTAARLQSAAPVNGILVDETTYRATEQPILYEPREAVEAKGKSEPIPVWEALEARSRFGVDVARTTGAPLVGRESEVGLLRDTLQRARQEASPQLVTLVGVPGIGKSRLVVGALLGADRGRAGPHLLAPGPMPALRRRRHVLGAQRDGESPRGHPRDRLGGSGRSSGSPASSRRCWKARPTGSGSRATSGRSSGCRTRSTAGAIARPRRSPPGGGSWKRSRSAARSCSSSRICTGRTTACWTSSTTSWTGRPECRCSSSAPLGPSSSRAVPAGAEASRTRRRSRSRRSPTTTPRASSTLCSSGRSFRPIFRPRCIERAGGNPLYAEEFARMVDELGEDGSDLRLPESVQGIIAARLDALPIEEKLLLQDASVVGKVFWLGPLERIGRPGPARSRAAPAPARAEGVRAPGAALVRRRGEPVRLQPPARR